MNTFPQEAQDLIQPLIPGQRGDFLNHLSLPLPKTVTINHQRISQDIFLSYAKKNERNIAPSPRGSDHCFQIQTQEGSPALGKSRIHQGGLCYIQEAAASIPAQYIRCAPGSTILDMCAAPGGKTTQLCNNNPESIVRANEPSHSRIKALGFNLQRMQCANAILTQIPGERFGTLFPETFDAILLDAPCSGEGTNFKSDFSFKYWKKENIKRTAGIQFQLLQSAFKATKPGGIIVYSTCTLNPIENEDNVERILQRAQGNLSLKKINNKTDYQVSAPEGNPFRLRPHIHHTGGFFVAVFEKSIRSDPRVSPHPKEHHTKKSSGKILSNQDVAYQYLQKLGVELSPNTLLRDTGNTINIIPKHIQNYADTSYFQKIGLPILKYSTERKGELRPTHGIASQTRTESDNTTRFTLKQAQDYCEGKDIELNNASQKEGYILITVDNIPLSVGKTHQGMIKNKFLR